MRTDRETNVHFKCTFTTIRRFSEILKCSQTMRAFSHNTHVPSVTVCLVCSLRRVETESRFLCTLYASLPARFLCVLYAEICVNATTGSLQKCPHLTCLTQLSCLPCNSIACFSYPCLLFPHIFPPTLLCHGLERTDSQEGRGGPKSAGSEAELASRRERNTF